MRRAPWTSSKSARRLDRGKRLVVPGRPGRSRLDRITHAAEASWEGKLGAANHGITWRGFESYKSASVNVGDVVVHGENVFEVRLVGKDVDHPGEHIRVKVSAFGNASLFGIDGAEHAELGMGGLIVVYAVFRCPADVDVPMPAADAEGDALVQLILGSVRIGGVHHTFQHVFQLWSAPVEQSSWFAGIEMEICLPGIGVADEVVLWLLQFWIRDVVAVEQSLTVVL